MSLSPESLSSVHTHLHHLTGQPPPEGPRGPGCGQPEGSGSLGRSSGQEASQIHFPRSPIRGRECRSWRCQGEGCEVARTQFGSSQVAELGLGQRPGLATVAFLGAGGGPPTLQGMPAKRSVKAQKSRIATLHTPSKPGGRACFSLHTTVQQTQSSYGLLPSPHPCPQQELSRTQSPLKAHAPIKPLITGLLPKALATPNSSKYLSRPGFLHASADPVPSA